MDHTASKIADKLYGYQPSAEQIARAEELRYMAEQIMPSSVGRRCSYDIAWCNGRESAADRLRQRADDIMSGIEQ